MINFNSKKEITFLFGAGAELDYGLCTGKEFIKTLLITDYLEERRQLIGENIARYNLIAPSSQKFFWRTIKENENIAQKNFDSKTLELCNEFYNESDNKNEHSHNVELRKKQCKEWYDMVVKDIPQKSKKLGKQKDFFFNYGCFFDSLDEKFNDLRMTIENNGNVKRLANSFYAIFIKLLKSLYDSIETWNLPEIINLLSQNYNHQDLAHKDNTYYNILSKYSFKRTVFTTNYTELSNLSKHDKDDEVIKLHGSLKWFEVPKKLTVYDIDNTSEKEELLNEINNGEFIIPFLHLPSGVKPIICSKQIKHFYEFTNSLSKSNILIIVGYKLNSDDNHINSMILEWLKKDDTKLIYFNYNNEVVFDHFNWCTNIKMFNENDINLKNDHGIYNITTTEKNCKKKYEDLLKTIQKEVC